MITQKYQYCAISRDESSGIRLYNCPDGSKVPSVTSILSATQSSDKIASLKAWRDRVGHDVATEITTTAAKIGTRMHKYLEEYVVSDIMPEAKTNPYTSLGISMANTIVKYGLSNVNEIWGSEVSLYYPELYAGTTDLVGVHCGDEAIIDFKQSNKPKTLDRVDDYKYQTVYYGMAHNYLHNTSIKKGVIMICVRPKELEPGKWDTPVYQEFIIQNDEWDYYEQLACKRLELYYTKKEKIYGTDSY